MKLINTLIIGFVPSLVIILVALAIICLILSKI